MDHGGEEVRSTMAGSADFGMPSAVQGSEANIGSGVVPVAIEFHLHPEPGPGVAYLNLGEFRRGRGRELAPVYALLALHLPGGVVLVHDNNDGYYSALQPRLGARRGVVLVDLLPGGAAVHSGDYALQSRPGAQREAFVGLLPGGGVAAFDDYVNYSLQPRPGAGHGEVIVGLLPDSAEHGEVFVSLLPGGGGAMHDDYGYYLWQTRLGARLSEVLVDQLPDGAGHGEVFVGLLPTGGGAVHGDYAWQPHPGAERGEVLPDGVHGIAGALRGPNLCRLVPLAGIGASSVAINGLAAGPGSSAAAFHLFVLLLGGLLLVILHVLRV